MDGTSLFSLRLAPELLAALADASKWRHMSVEDYVRTVLETATKMDIDLAAFVQEGVDSADRGELISQEEMEAWFEARHRPAAAE